MARNSNQNMTMPGFLSNNGNNNANSLDSDDFTLYIYLWTIRITIPLSIVIGVPGNFLTAIVFAKDPCDSSPTARFYYILMAIADTIVLLIEMLPDFLALGIPALSGADWLPSGNTKLCRVVHYFWILTQNASDYTLVVLCLERLFAIHSPLKAMALITVPRAILLVAAIVVLLGLLDIPSLFTFTSITFQDVTDCLSDASTAGLAMYFGVAICTLLLPVLLDTICNVFLAVAITKAGERRRRLQNSDSQKIPHKELSVTMTVLFISCFHMIVYVPASATWMAFAVIKAKNMNGMTIQVAFHIAYSLLRCTCLTRWTNFLVYLTRMPKFRRRLVQVVTCKG